MHPFNKAAKCEHREADGTDLVLYKPIHLAQQQQRIETCQQKFGANIRTMHA